MSVQCFAEWHKEHPGRREDHCSSCGERSDRRPTIGSVAVASILGKVVECEHNGLIRVGKMKRIEGRRMALELASSTVLIEADEFHNWILRSVAGRPVPIGWRG